jgi:hypothetical protein
LKVKKISNCMVADDKLNYPKVHDNILHAKVVFLTKVVLLPQAASSRAERISVTCAHDFPCSNLGILICVLHHNVSKTHA